MSSKTIPTWLILVHNKQKGKPVLLEQPGEVLYQLLQAEMLPFKLLLGFVTNDFKLCGTIMQYMEKHAPYGISYGMSMTKKNPHRNQSSGRHEYNIWKECTLTPIEDYWTWIDNKLNCWEFWMICHLTWKVKRKSLQTTYSVLIHKQRNLPEEQ